MYNERVIGRTTFGSKYRLHRFSAACIGPQSVHGFRREGYRLSSLEKYGGLAYALFRCDQSLSS
ncbi:hypothetical protein D3C74_497330 [compost metagenome]